MTCHIYFIYIFYYKRNFRSSSLNTWKKNSPRSFSCRTSGHLCTNILACTGSTILSSCLMRPLPQAKKAAVAPVIATTVLLRIEQKYATCQIDLFSNSFFLENICHFILLWIFKQNIYIWIKLVVQKPIWINR